MINVLFSKLGYTHNSVVDEREQQDFKKLADIQNEVKKYKGKLEFQKAKFIKKADELNNLQNSLKKPTGKKQRIQRWSKRVRSTGCCDCCGDTESILQAHHLWSKSIHFSLMYETTNGVPLCPTCHENYHKKYPNIENCNPYTYNEFKTDENNKTRLLIVEAEVKTFKENTIKNKIKKALNLIKL